MRMGHRARGFTLIEMLMVVLVMMILTGIVLRLTDLVSRKAARAKAVYELEQIQNALNEYYAEYGTYPPVDRELYPEGDPRNNPSGMRYEYENCTTNYQTAWFREVFLPSHNDPDNQPMFFSDQERDDGGWPQPGHNPEWVMGYRYGLVSYIYLRHRECIQHWYDRDTSRDEAAKTNKFLHFIDDVGPDSGVDVPHASPGFTGAFCPYTNSVDTLFDPWGNDYVYDSNPPYVSYTLFSIGPDCIEGNADDIHRNSWNE